jgi:hypothetical protein
MLKPGAVQFCRYTTYQRELIKKWRRAHLNKQATERAAMNEKRARARKSGEGGKPLEAFFLIDAMTEFKTTTPRFASDSTGAPVQGDNFQARTFGVEVVCGKSVDGYFIYTTDNYMGKGADLMVEIQRQAFADLEELLQSRGKTIKGGVVHLHYDNSTENKNKTMFFYLSMLVELDIFDVVNVDFLMVGHTHSSIDQYFSQLSKIIGSAPFLGTPLALHHLFKTHLNERRPLVCRSVEVYFDCTAAWDRSRYMYRHYNAPHVYRILKRGEKACMEYMLYSGEQWLPKPPRVKEIQR